MEDLFEKCRKFTTAKEVMEMGIYPYFHRVEGPQEPVVIIEGREVIMAGSNNYLGLTNNTRVKTASIRAILKYGVGCVGSRFLNGTLDLHEELERRIARFMKKEAALTFTTGMQTNLGVISALAGRDDNIVVDRYVHASIMDACRLSFGKLYRFKHNDMEDLERILKSINSGGTLIVVDGVYSMEGDLANLPEIVRLKEKYGARLMVDDAHGVGVLGKHGRGTAEHFGVENQVDIIMSSFSKSFASIGGFIASTNDVIHYVKHFARALIFSASPPPAVAASVLKALDIIERNPDLRKRLLDNADYVRRNLKNAGFDVGTSHTSPIIPVIIGNDRAAFIMWRKLFDRGVFTTPVVSPAVPENRALIRISIMATHKKEHLDKIIETFKAVGSELGIIQHKITIPKEKTWRDSFKKWMRQIYTFGYRGIRRFKIRY